MSLPNANFWVRADLTFFATVIAEQPYTQTLSFTNKPILENTVSEVYFPILQNLSDFGVRMGTFIPGESSATLTLFNGLHSLGYNRCITDLLQRYTLINQDVKIYIALDTPDDLDPESWIQVFQGKIDALQYNASDVTQTLSIAIHADTLPIKEIAPTVPTLVGATTTPADSSSVVNDSSGINKIVPVLFGQNQVKPISQGLGFGNVYVYGATFSDQFNNGGVLKYYAKNHRGAYVYVRGAATTTTVQFEDGGAATGGFFTWAGQKELIFPFNQTARGATDYNEVDTSGNNFILTTMKVQMTSKVGLSASGPEDRYILKIYELDDQGLPTIELARSEQPVDSYPAWTSPSAADYTVCFDLNKPVVIDEASNFAWSISTTKDTGSSWSLKMKRYSKAGNAKYWKVDGTDLSINKHPATDTAGPKDYPYFWAYGVSFSDSPTGSVINNKGYGISFFTAERPYTLGAASGPTAIPDLGFDWDFLVYVKGLTDDGSGSITGTADKLIQSPLDIIRLFSWEWDGADWVDSGDFDDTAYDYGHAAAFYTTGSPILRRIQGRINNRISLSALLEKLCQNSGTRIAVRSNGQFGVWAWGTNAPEVATIDQNDLRILSITFSGAESVINNASITYEKFIYQSQFTRVIENQSVRDYAFALAWNNLAPAKASELTRFRPSAFSANNFTMPTTNHDSVEAFGESTLRLSEFDLLGDSSSVEAILSFYFAFYGLPSVFVSGEIPLERYYMLELLDVIKIQHPMLPSFYGSSSHNQLSYNDNGANPDWKSGLYNPRSETYRAIVESKQFSLGRGQTPTMKLQLRILNNYPKDPT